MLKASLVIQQSDRYQSSTGKGRAEGVGRREEESGWDEDNPPHALPDSQVYHLSIPPYFEAGQAIQVFYFIYDSFHGK
jgi:hypothetical protein